MLDVAIRPRAQLDLESIYTYIAIVLEAPKAADDTLKALYQTVELVASVPDLGTPFESERLSRPYRRMLSRNYWIYYSVEGERLVVWRIFHTRQDIDDSTLVEF